MNYTICKNTVNEGKKQNKTKQNKTKKTNIFQNPLYQLHIPY